MWLTQAKNVLWKTYFSSPNILLWTFSNRKKSWRALHSEYLYTRHPDATISILLCLYQYLHVLYPATISSYFLMYFKLQTLVQFTPNVSFFLFFLTPNMSCWCFWAILFHLLGNRSWIFFSHVFFEHRILIFCSTFLILLILLLIFFLQKDVLFRSSWKVIESPLQMNFRQIRKKPSRQPVKYGGDSIARASPHSHTSFSPLQVD